jgi:hypothetical protein
MLRLNVRTHGVVRFNALQSVVIWCLGTAAFRAEDAKVRLVALGNSITRGAFGPAW